MPTRKAPDPPVADDIGQRVAGEGLAPDDGEDTDDGRHHRRHPTDDQRRVHLGLAKKPGSNSQLTAAQRRSR